jgi:hypothetical protein
MHISYTCDPENKDLKNAVLVHFSRCIKLFRLAIQDVNKQNAPAVFITAIFLVFLTQAVMYGSEDPYQTPATMLHMAKGLMILMVQTGKWLEGTKCNNFIAVGHNIGWTKIESDFLLAEDERTDLDALLAGLEIDSEEYAIYDTALVHIRDFHDAALSGADAKYFQHRFCQFAGCLPYPFIKLVDQHDPRALCILAHHFAMARFAEGNWWLANTAQIEVYGLQSLVPEEWQWAMWWPLYITNRPLRTDTGLPLSTLVDEFTSRPMTGEK